MQEYLRLIFFSQFILNSFLGGAIFAENAQFDFVNIQQNPKPEPMIDTGTPSDDDTKVYQPGNSADVLRRNATAFYTNLWRQYQSWTKHAYIDGVVARLEENLRIKFMNENASVISWSAPGRKDKEVVIQDSIWEYTDGVWRPRLMDLMPYQRIHQLDLNSDGISDWLIVGHYGSDEHQYLQILVGSQKDKLHYRQNIYTQGQIELVPAKNCATTINLYSRSNKEIRKRLIFDCKINGFRIVKP